MEDDIEMLDEAQVIESHNLNGGEEAMEGKDRQIMYRTHLLRRI